MRIPKFKFYEILECLLLPLLCFLARLVICRIDSIRRHEVLQLGLLQLVQIVRSQSQLCSGRICCFLTYYRFQGGRIWGGKCPHKNVFFGNHEHWCHCIFGRIPCSGKKDAFRGRKCENVPYLDPIYLEIRTSKLRLVDYATWL